MERILEHLKDKKILKNKTFSGVNDGEKVFLCYEKKRGVIVTPDFVTAVRFKKALISLGKKVEILSTGREIGKKKDDNLRQNMSFISKFMSEELDFLIYLPVSVLTKFSYNKITDSMTFRVGEKIVLESVEKKLVEIRFNKQFRNFSQVFEVADGIVFYDNADNMKIVGSYLAKELFISEDAPEWTKEIKEEYLIFSKGTREIKETNLIFAGPTFNLYQKSARQFVPQEKDKMGEDDRKTSK